MNARFEIEDVKDETPTVTDKAINSEWDKVFSKAIKKVSQEMNLTDDEERKFKPETLTWKEVFEKIYYLEDKD